MLNLTSDACDRVIQRPLVAFALYNDRFFLHMWEQPNSWPPTVFWDVLLLVLWRPLCSWVITFLVKEREGGSEGEMDCVLLPLLKTEWTSDSDLNDIDELIDRSCDVIIPPLVGHVDPPMSAPCAQWAQGIQPLSYCELCEECCVFLRSFWLVPVLGFNKSSTQWPLPYQPWLQGVEMQFVLLYSLVLVWRKKKKNRWTGEEMKEVSHWNGKHRAHCVKLMPPPRTSLPFIIWTTELHLSDADVNT